MDYQTDTNITQKVGIQEDENS